MKALRDWEPGLLTALAPVLPLLEDDHVTDLAVDPPHVGGPAGTPDGQGSSVRPPKGRGFPAVGLTPLRGP